MRTLGLPDYLAAFLLITAAPSSASAQTILLSDSFNRTPAGTGVGTAPTKDTSAAAQADAAANWASDWGANDNAAGGTISQTYTTYIDNIGQKFKVDGTNGISGNWLNNGLTLKKTGGTDTTTEPIGLPGFGWVQINENFATNATVAAATTLRVNFDLYRSASGNVSWFFGQDDPTGVANGNAGSPAVIANNDIGIYWRGIQANTFGLRDNGALPSPVTGISNYDTIAYAAGTALFPQPIAIRIDITGTNFAAGQTSLVEMWVNGTQQDLNGADAAGAGYNLTWDAGGAAYMGFGSNSTPVEGTVAAPVYRASGIDNLVISAVAAAPANNADFDSSGIVDGTDFLIWQRGFGLTGQTSKTNGNANTDSLVDGLDLAEWRAKFGGAPVVSVAASVPEPSTAALVGCLLVLGVHTFAVPRRTA